MKALSYEIGAFWLGDSPAEPSTIELDGDPTAYDQATVTLRAPSGMVDGTIPATIGDDADTISITWPANTFTEAGRWSARIVLTSESQRTTIAPLPFIVQADDGWHTLDSARDEWTDAPTTDASLWTVLEIAKEQVIEFGPLIPEGDLPPTRFVQAQLMQARNTWNAVVVDPSNGQIGDDSFQIRPFPLDWSVKNVIRPKKAVPWVG